jgi:uncharacterized damage-inducible protein DinB
MNPQSIRDLFEYSYWAFDLIWPSIHQLDDDQFVMDLDYSFGSIRNQIIHLVSSHRRWINRLQSIQPVTHLNFENFSTISMVEMEWGITRDEMLDYVNSLNQADLDKVVSYKIQGRSIDAAHRRWEILLHLVNHSTDHRSQILAMLNIHFNIDTPEQDYIIYLWEKCEKG